MSETEDRLFSSLGQSRLVQVAGSLLAVVGSAGGGLAAASFGIGYFALRHHNEMVGIPTTALDAAAYVRAGALFFSNSAYYLFKTALWRWTLLSLAVLLVVWAVSGQHRSRWFKLARDRLWEWRIPLCLALHCAVLVLGLFLVNLGAAPFDPDNRNLLYRLVTDAPPQAVPPAEPVLTASDTDYAERVRGLLRHPEGRSLLQEFYGQLVALLLLFLAAFTLLQLWRARINTGTPPSSAGSCYIAPVDLLLRPVLYLLALALLLNLPAAYGVLCLPTSGLHVIVETKEEGFIHGVLLTDLSSASKEIWLLGADDEFKTSDLKLIPRGQVLKIKLTSQNVPNYLSKEPFKAGAQP